MERIGFATTYLEVEECCEIRNLFLDTSKSNHTVELGQTLSVVDSLRSVIGNILHVNHHQLLVRERRDIDILQTLSLLGANLVEQLAHSTSVGEVLVARIV